MANYLGYTKESSQAIDALLGYRNQWVIDRYVSEYRVDVAYADRVSHSFNQFMATCVLTGGPKTTSPMIDGMWHVFLLNTRQYSEYCERYLRGFVHHEPSDQGADPALYVRTREFALNLFSSLDSECCPVTGKADCSSGCGTIDRRFE